MSTYIMHTAGERTAEGFYACKGGIEAAIARGLAYAPFAGEIAYCL